MTHHMLVPYQHSPRENVTAVIWQRWLPFARATLRRRPAKGGMTMTFRPLHDRVLVRRIEAEAKTAGGIIIPDTAKEKSQEGEIVAVGTGLRAEDGTVIPLDVKAGDKILFGKWSGSEVKLDGEDLLIMKESDVGRDRLTPIHRPLDPI
jgi:chaperonin GroES